jgi:hypothetical protein
VDRPDIRVYVGKGGCGKSTLARRHFADAPRVLIHDHNGERGNAIGAHVVSDRAQLLELLVRPGPVRVCWSYVGIKGRPAIIDHFEWANRCAWAAGDLVVVWDEADRLTGGKLEENAHAIVNQGRHRDLVLFAGARRPRWVPRDLTASATAIYAFRTTEPRDVEYLRDTMGEAAETLPQLGEHDYLHWREDGSATRHGA